MKWIWWEEVLKWWDGSEQPLESERKCFLKMAGCFARSWFLGYIFGVWRCVKDLPDVRLLVSPKRSAGEAVGICLLLQLYCSTKQTKDRLTPPIYASSKGKQVMCSMGVMFWASLQYFEHHCNIMSITVIFWTLIFAKIILCRTLSGTKCRGRRDSKDVRRNSHGQ